MPLVMGVASVAARTRVEVRDADDGHLVAVGAAYHGDATSRRQQPVETWWDGMVEAVTAADLRAEVAGLAVAAQRHALVLLDGAGAALLAASLRADDRSGTVAGDLVRRLGADRLARATGQVPGSDTPLTRLVHLVATEPTIAGRVDAVLGAADLLTARLTGRRVTDRAGASGTGWWDPVAGRWRVDLLARVARPAPPDGWAAVLPAILRPAEPADRARAGVPDLVGLRGRPLVAAGTGELMARALAAGIGAGTAAALLSEDDPAVVAGALTAVADATGEVLGLADAAGGYLPTVPVAQVGRTLAAVARLLGTDADGLARRAVTAGDGPATGRLIVVPGITEPTGRRPGPRPTAVLGLGDADGPAELARAALLGAAAEVVTALARLDTVGGGEPDDGKVVLAGSVARWPGLARAVADLSGREVVLVRAGGAAAGACAQAAAALHDRDPLEVARAWKLDRGEEIEPSAEVDTVAVLAAHEAAREGSR